MGALTPAEKKLLQKLRAKAGDEGIFEALKETPAAPAPKKRGKIANPVTNPIGVWVAIEIKRDQYGRSASAMVARDIKQYFPAFKLTQKRLQNVYSEASNMLSAYPELLRAADGLLEILRAHVARAPVKCIVLPMVMDRRKTAEGDVIDQSPFIDSARVNYSHENHMTLFVLPGEASPVVCAIFVR